LQWRLKYNREQRKIRTVRTKKNNNKKKQQQLIFEKHRFLFFSQKLWYIANINWILIVFIKTKLTSAELRQRERLANVMWIVHLHRYVLVSAYMATWRQLGMEHKIHTTLYNISWRLKISDNLQDLFTYLFLIILSVSSLLL
jgi:hypothetical protein